VPSLDLVIRGPDMAAVHSAVIVRALTTSAFHTKSYTIFEEEKGFGRRIGELSGNGKEGTWTWWWTTLYRSPTTGGPAVAIFLNRFQMRYNPKV
jgi:hypothetical protein